MCDNELRLNLYLLIYRHQQSFTSMKVHLLWVLMNGIRLIEGILFLWTLSNV